MIHTTSNITIADLLNRIQSLQDEIKTNTQMIHNLRDTVNELDLQLSCILDEYEDSISEEEKYPMGPRGCAPPP